MESGVTESSMTKQFKKTIYAILIVTALIAVAVICRVVTRL